MDGAAFPGYPPRPHGLPADYDSAASNSRSSSLDAHGSRSSTPLRYSTSDSDLEGSNYTISRTGTDVSLPRGAEDDTIIPRDGTGSGLVEIRRTMMIHSSGNLAARRHQHPRPRSLRGTQSYRDISQATPTPSLPDVPTVMKKKQSKQLRCYVPGCSYLGRFRRRWELERHVKGTHLLKPAVGNKNFYRCRFSDCRDHAKLWARVDRFRTHTARCHPGFDVDQIMKVSIDDRAAGLSVLRGVGKGLSKQDFRIDESTIPASAVTCNEPPGFDDGLHELFARQSLGACQSKSPPVDQCSSLVRSRTLAKTIAQAEEALSLPNAGNLSEGDRTRIGLMSQQDVALDPPASAPPTQAASDLNHPIIDPKVSGLGAPIFAPRQVSDAPTEVEVDGRQDNQAGAIFHGSGTSEQTRPIRSARNRRASRASREAPTPYNVQQGPSERLEDPPDNHDHRLVCVYLFVKGSKARLNRYCDGPYRWIGDLKRHHKCHHLWYCTKCFGRFHTQKKRDDHKKKGCKIFKCVEPGCEDNFGVMNPVDTCEHGKTNSQEAIWAAVVQIAQQAELTADTTRDRDDIEFTDLNREWSKELVHEIKKRAHQHHALGPTEKSLSAIPGASPVLSSSSAVTASAIQTNADMSSCENIGPLATLASMMVRHLEKKPPQMSDVTKRMYPLYVGDFEPVRSILDRELNVAMRNMVALKTLCYQLRDTIQHPENSPDVDEHRNELRSWASAILPPILNKPSQSSRPPPVTPQQRMNLVEDEPSSSLSYETTNSQFEQTPNADTPVTNTLSFDQSQSMFPDDFDINIDFDFEALLKENGMDSSTNLDASTTMDENHGNQLGGLHPVPVPNTMWNEPDNSNVPREAEKNIFPKDSGYETLSNRSAGMPSFRGLDNT